MTVPAVPMSTNVPTLHAMPMPAAQTATVVSAARAMTDLPQTVSAAVILTNVQAIHATQMRLVATLPVDSHAHATLASKVLF